VQTRKVRTFSKPESRIYRVLVDLALAGSLRPVRYLQCLSLWLIGTVRAEPETVISWAWVQSPDRQKKLFQDYWRACFEINFSVRQEGLTMSSIICDR